MQQYMFHEIANTEIYGVLNVLDYETTIKALLEQISFPPAESIRTIVVDLALKSGINKYRFLRLDVDQNGDVIWKGDAYYCAPQIIEENANRFLKERADIVYNSVLSDKTISRIIDGASQNSDAL